MVSEQVDLSLSLHCPSADLLPRLETLTTSLNSPDKRNMIDNLLRQKSSKFLKTSQLGRSDLTSLTPFHESVLEGVFAAMVFDSFDDLRWFKLLDSAHSDGSCFGVLTSATRCGDWRLRSD